MQQNNHEGPNGRPMIFLSFGGGVQSSVLLMMAVRGEIAVDHVIFADTGFEADTVYAHVEWCKDQCRKVSLPFHIAAAETDMREDFHGFENSQLKHWDARPPLWVRGGHTHEITHFSRQCTSRAKVRPINKLALSLMNKKNARGLPAGSAAFLIGISTDEARRAAPSRDKWIDRQYPLIDPLRMSRGDCQAWWDRHYSEVALPTSSCTICPYHSDSHWRDMSPDDMAQAIEYDERIRLAYQQRTGQDVYLHRSGRPLRSIDFAHGQSDLFDDDDIVCAGGCGL